MLPFSSCCVADASHLAEVIDLLKETHPLKKDDIFL